MSRAKTFWQYLLDKYGPAEAKVRYEEWKRQKRGDVDAEGDPERPRVKMVQKTLG